MAKPCFTDHPPIHPPIMMTSTKVMSAKVGRQKGGQQMNTPEQVLSSPCTVAL